MIPNALHLMDASASAPRMGIAWRSGVFASGIFSSGVFTSFEGWAQVAIERVVHSLPEGIQIALFAWAVLRLLPKQNSGTRFGVWFVALLAVVGLACVELPHSNFAPSATSGWSALRFGSLDFSSLRVSEVHLPAHWAGYLFIAWLGLAAVGLARLLAGLWHLREMRRSCVPVNAAELDAAIVATMSELNGARGFGSRRVTLASSERARVPSALGLWQPMIVLPAWALAELPASELSIILRHEFAHLRRWDDWTNLVQKTVRAVFFFHPAVWWIESRLAVEREMACDDIVVAETDNPMGYANCLVSLLERSLAQRGWTMAQAIVHRAREASERVAQILDKNRPAARGISKPLLGLVGTFAALCAVMLPATPQFVAFDRVTAGAEPAYSAGLARGARFVAADYRGAWRPAVIAADLRTSTKVSKANVSASVATSVRPVSPKRTSAAPDSAGSLSGAPIRGQIVAQAIGQSIGQSNERSSGAELADSNSASTPDSSLQENADVRSAADRDGRPAVRMVLVRETQFVSAEVPVYEFSIVALPRGPVMVWSMRMMRVTVVAPVWKEMRLPAAKKI
jgi:beta-lactamase regulating signal transducer with metallopeptidase domain